MSRPPAALDLAATIDAALRRAREIQARHPFAAVAILAPGGEAARAVARRMATSGEPWLNVRVETVPGHIDRLAEAPLADEGRAPFPDDEACAILRRALDALSGTPKATGERAAKGDAGAPHAYFAAAAEFDSYTHRFRRLIEELRLNLPDREIRRALKSAALGRKGSEILALFDAYLEGKGIRADRADRLDLAPADGEHLVLLPETDALLPKRVADRLDATEAKGRLTRIEWATRAEPPAVDAWRAATTGAEVREALREILRRETPLDRALLLVPRDRLDAAQVELALLGVPFRSPEGATPARPAFERFETFLDALDADAAYPELERHLLAANQVGALHALYRMARNGPAQGIDRMRAWLEEEKRAKEEGPEYRPDALSPAENGSAVGSWETGKKGSGRDRLLALLGELKSARPLRGRPHDLGIAVGSAVIGRSRAARVLSHWCESLKRTDPDIPYDRWRSELRRRMEGLRTPAADDARALTVTSVPLAGAYDLVFHLGMTEHGFPGQHRQDPLLLDDEREAINQATGARLVTARLRNDRAALALDFSLACAGAAWFGSFPALEPETGRENSASFLLKEFWLARHAPASASADAREALWRGLLERERGFTPTAPAEALHQGEWLLARLLVDDADARNGPLALFPSARAHLAAYNDFWNGADVDRPWLAGPPPRGRDARERGFSPTELEKFMGCPYRWFLEKDLRLRTRPAPGSLEELDAATVGTLVHGMLETCMRKHGADAKDLSAAKRSRLVDDALNDWIRENGDLGDFHRKQAAETLAGFLERFLEHEAGLPPEREPLALERAFGYDRKRGAGEPLRLKIGRRTLPLSGMIDRIDRQGRTAVVLDYKTGRKKTTHRDFTDPADFAGGTHLQPALYAEVVLQHLHAELEVDDVETGYLPLRENSEEFTAPCDAGMRKTLAGIVDLILSCIGRGFFPRATDPETCRYCDFAALCGPRVTPASRRKLARPKGTCADLADRWRAIREDAEVEA